MIASVIRRTGEGSLYQHAEERKRGRHPERSPNHPSLLCSPGVSSVHKSISLGHKDSLFCSHYSLQLSLCVPAPLDSFSKQLSLRGKHLAAGLSGGMSRRRRSLHPPPAPAVSGQSPLGRQSCSPPAPTWGHLPFLMPPAGKRVGVRAICLLVYLVLRPNCKT